MMPSPNRLSAALLVLRLSIGAFLIVWTSLKFIRPEWMVNVFTNTYGMAWVTQDHAILVGTAQALIVAAFILGVWRTVTYAVTTLMHATGVAGTLISGALFDFASYPQNLLWTSVPTLGALVALFMLRQHDGFTIQGLSRS